jgi:hypothetical protein
MNKKERELAKDAAVELILKELLELKEFVMEALTVKEESKPEKKGKGGK